MDFNRFSHYKEHYYQGLKHRFNVDYKYSNHTKISSYANFRHSRNQRFSEIMSNNHC